MQGGFIVGKLKFGGRIEVDMQETNMLKAMLESGFLGFYMGAELCMYVAPPALHADWIYAGSMFCGRDDTYMVPINMAQNAGLISKSLKIPSFFNPKICFNKARMSGGVSADVHRHALRMRTPTGRIGIRHHLAKVYGWCPWGVLEVPSGIVGTIYT